MSTLTSMKVARLLDEFTKIAGKIRDSCYGSYGLKKARFTCYPSEI